MRLIRCSDKRVSATEAQSAPSGRFGERSPGHSQPPRSGSDPLLGRVIDDRYRILATIAQGGMGRIYRAEQTLLGRSVALKVLNSAYSDDEHPEFRRRFFLEASICARLTHPNTVTIFDYGGTTDGIYYMAMELLKGYTLHQALQREGRFPPARAIHVAQQICRSLREAHRLGVIHRDLKPANVFLVQHEDERDFVKVLDFGLVKHLGAKSPEITQRGLFMGSPKYMSPEQIRTSSLDGRSDVYSLGIMLYEMLTGKVPFNLPTSVTVLMAHVHDEPPPMREINPNVRVDPALEALVMKAIAKAPENRFQSIHALFRALTQVSSEINAQGNPGVSSPDRSGAGERPRQPRRPSPSAPQSGERPFFPRARMFPDTGGAESTPPPHPNDRLKKRSSEWGHIKTRVSSRTNRTLPDSKRARWIGVVIFLIVAAAAGYWFRDPRHQSFPFTQSESKPLAKAATPDVGVLKKTTKRQKIWLRLRSDPHAALVRVGDRVYGPTPIDVEWVDAKAAGDEITFRFERPGYEPLSVVRKLRGPSLTVSAKMQPTAPQTTPPPRSTQLESAAGTKPQQAPPMRPPPPIPNPNRNPQSPNLQPPDFAL